MADWEEQHGAGEVELYFCECADLDCREKLALTKAQYERVRSRSRQFAVLAGHDIADVESVIERLDNWAIVEKTPEVGETLDRLDPRSSG
jgi:hypothetical protein